MKQTVSLAEAREILGEKAEGMSDDEIQYVIDTLRLMAQDALGISREQVHMKRDAYRLAQLTYDVYKDKNTSKD